MAPQKLQVGCAGLGRMGKRHADNFLHRAPRATMVAVFTPDPTEFQWGKVELEPHGVTIYKSYEEMLKHPGLQAVVIATVTAVHAQQAMQAMAANKHVLCEKPLSISAEKSREVVDFAAKRPHLKVMCGFSRRFDTSYNDAYTKMEAGLIGRPSIFRSQTVDKHDPSSFFVAYAEHSGGIFVDCSIHDIDLALWFFGSDSSVKSVVASGITAVQPELRKFNDRDNAVGIIELYGGKIAYVFCSRMNAAGQEDTTEIIGTQGKLAVNTAPAQNLVQFHSPTGISRDIAQNYYDRFRDAFTKEANVFTGCCLDNKPLPMKLSSAVEAVKIGGALQESMISGKKISFDTVGKRIEIARL